MSDLQQALLPLITECKLTRNNTTSIYRYTIVLSYICALIRSCIRSHTVVMLSGARRPCVHLGCVTPAARCKFYLQLPLGSSILSYHCERLTRQFGIVTQNFSTFNEFGHCPGHDPYGGLAAENSKTPSLLIIRIRFSCDFERQDPRSYMI